MGGVKKKKKNGKKQEVKEQAWGKWSCGREGYIITYIMIIRGL